MNHQFKIPRTIELYGYTPPKLDGEDLNASHLLGGLVNFKKLGHFSIDDNSKTNYTARELKSVYLNTTLQYLRLSFMKNHMSDKNIFN